MSTQKKTMEEKLKEANYLLDVQRHNENWSYDSYMLGLFNGMELVLAIFEERDPDYRDQEDVEVVTEWNKVMNYQDLEFMPFNQIRKLIE